MRRLVIPLLLLASLNGSVRAADDPMVLAYKIFFKERIAGEWEGDLLSEMKVVLVRDFARHDVPGAARWLMEQAVLGSEEGDVIRAALLVLSGYKSQDTLSEMVRIWEKKFKKPAEKRALGLWAFSGSKLDIAGQPIGLGLQDRDPRVVQSACRVAAVAQRRNFIPQLVKLLGHKEWANRGAAALALGELNAQEAMPEIFKVFCGDKSHRVRYDCWIALKKLSLQKSLPCDPADWEEWWTGERKDAQAGLEEGQKNPWGEKFPHLYTKIARPAPFFRIPVLADRICFVIDASQSMLEPWKIDPKAEREKRPEDRTPGFFNVKTRWGLTRNWLKELLRKLPDTTEFAFVFYSNEITRYPDGGKFLKNNEKARNKAFKFMEEDLRQKATTAMYDGLENGWGFVKEGSPDHNFKRGCETLVFVTDGTPTDGKLRKREDRIRDEVWRIAAARGVRIHVVGIHRHSFELLKSMAKDSGGLYVHAQEPGVADEPQDLEFWPEKKKAFEKARKRR